MSHLILDLSPTLINRTAMFHISRDVARLLSADCQSYMYCGHAGPMEPAPAEAARLRRHLDSLIALAASSPKQLRNHVHRTPGSLAAAAGSRRVFLDPLYILFCDLTPDDVVMVLDLSPVTNPEWHGKAVAALYREAFERIAAVRPQLLSISGNTADAMVANFGFPADRIAVVRLYVPAHLRKAADGASPLPAVHPYFLFVGSLEARKNVKGAIRAFRASGLGDRGYRLLIVGGRGHGAEEIHSLSDGDPSVVLCGYVSDDDLPSFYAGATGFLYPSYLEGFGVPLLEAMQYGIPCVASTTGACPEVGGELVPYVDPDDHPGFAAHLRRIAALTPEERADIAQRSRQRVDEQFGFHRFATAFRSAVLPSPDPFGRRAAAEGGFTMPSFEAIGAHRP